MRTPKGPLKILDSKTAQMLLPRKLRHAARSRYTRRGYKPAWKLDPDRKLGEGPPK